jgi:phosphoribosylaminoimidazolecarboxamide formyltransferase/IMP cyclohydrolase
MQKKIQSALISVFYKDGLDAIARRLQELGIVIYSTGGTEKFIKDLGIRCVPVESLTTYPSILGGRVKTLHPAVFGGILGRRDLEQDMQEMKQYDIPEIDLVIVDLYPFEETLASTSDEKQIIEKIDIGGPSMIRAAAKNFKDLLVVAAKDDYAALLTLLTEQKGETSIEQRKQFAAKAFEIVMKYDIAISNYFNSETALLTIDTSAKQSLRYGENPHQEAVFYGDLKRVFAQLHGKEISYNNLVDIDAAIQLIKEFPKLHLPLLNIRMFVVFHLDLL